MKITTKAFILLFILLASTYAQALPSAFTATYKVQKSGIYLGQMRSTLSYQGEHYQYHKKTTAKGLAAMLSGDVLIENSDGIVRNDNFITQRYLRHHVSKRKDQKEQFHFSSATSVQGQYENKSYTLTVPNNTTDLTVLEVKLMQALASNKIDTQYNIINRGQVKHYNIQRLGTETLNLAVGNVTCEKIRISKKDSDIQTIIWFANDMNYAPARIKHIDDGDALEARMISYKAQ